MISTFHDKKNPPFQFASKATTLERLASSVATVRFCDQIIVTNDQWSDDRDRLVSRIIDRFNPRTLVVRSSAAAEDNWNDSLAGAHLSVIGVAPSVPAIATAIDDVFASYTGTSPEDEVLVQPMVEDVVISGVVLTRDLDSGSPYYVINYDDRTGRTDTVTGGAESTTVLVHRQRTDKLKSARLGKLINGVREIEAVTASHELDIEFCITREEEVYILQVRPLAARKRWSAPPDVAIYAAIDGIRTAIDRRMAPAAGIAGRTTILAEMTDWNPAEMIGNTPKPLALSLYKTLITDRIWADARAEMGYRRVNEALLVDYEGRPYIDVRLSLNSFLPATIDDALAHRLVDAQITRLAERRDLHDKVEFEVAVTCRDFAFETARRRLAGDGLSALDLDTFEEALGGLTRLILTGGRQDIDRQTALCDRLFGPEGNRQSPSPRDGLGSRLEECRRFGTLPFSKVARHGFMGILFLKSLVARDVLSQRDADMFMHAIHTVAADLVHDINRVDAGAMDREDFLAEYGHLRPGTYDIESWRYDERPELYLGHVGRTPVVSGDQFRLSPAQEAATGTLLKEFGYDLTPAALLEYIAMAVRAREHVKFRFTRCVSDTLADIALWGERIGLSREELSLLAIRDILETDDVIALKERVAKNREGYAMTRAIRLPHQICEPADVDIVRLPLGQPTFITDQSVTAKICHLTTAETADIDDRIVLIENADPGFDWIFSHPVVGLITKYGGTNSHMAIRCAEFGLPAAIGCGERLFNIMAKAAVVELNCAARKLSGH